MQVSVQDKDTRGGDSLQVPAHQTTVLSTK